MIEPITFGIAMGAFLFGYIAHSNNENKASAKSMDTMLEQNKELVSLSSTIEILNRDIDKKNSLIAELEGEASHQEENISRLLERANYVRNSGELEKLDELATVTKNLRKIKENLAKIQSRQVERFNISVLISLVQTQYEDIHGEELDLLGVQDLMTGFSDSGTGGNGDSFGGMVKNPARSGRTKLRSPGV